MIKLPTFTVLGAPRTKKTSAQLIKSLGRPLIIPSEAYLGWFKIAMLQVPEILREIRTTFNYSALPTQYPVSVRAIFYRAQASGDLLGYAQALADWMQAPKMSRTKPGKLSRNGAGIIQDDVQIVSWDGSRLAKDAARPRIEVTLTLYPEGTQEALPLTDAW